MNKNFIHPTAIIGPNVTMGTGNYIGPYCIIGMPPEWRGKEDAMGEVIIGNNNRFTGLVTVDAAGEVATIIQNDCYLMKHSHVGHDAVLCDNVTLSCGAKVGGHAIIGKGCNIGLNAVIHQKQKIKEGCMIGMGSVVTKKLVTEPYGTYGGNPAKFLKLNLNHPDFPEYTFNMRETI